MQASAQSNYLETEVMTAPPQKLQLMLVEAAIRSAERARAMWREEDDELYRQHAYLQRSAHRKYRDFRQGHAHRHVGGGSSSGRSAVTSHP